MESQTRFVATAWRDSQELLQLRHDLYSSETVKKENAVSKVFAWRSRKPDGLPLLLDSTADIVDVILQDERAELKHNALRLLYATAISRFITGLADTQIELTRDRPSFFPPGKSLQLPLSLLEVRHRIVHRHLPSLAELKRAAAQSLEWLWEWYWSQLDHAFRISAPAPDGEVESLESIKDRLQSILKTYIKERKTAIKTRKTGLNAAENALSTYMLRFGGSNNTPPPTPVRDILLDILIHDILILPADKKLGSTMSGAFLIWTPFLLAFCSPSTTTTSPIITLPTLLTHIQHAMNAPSSSRMMVNLSLDPVREGMHDWILHLLGSTDCATLRGMGDKAVVENVLTTCFSEPSRWNVKLAESILGHAEWRGKGVWGELLDALKGGGEDGVAEGGVDMEIDVDVEGIDEAVPVTTSEDMDIVLKEKSANVGQAKKEEHITANTEQLKGPQKVLGMWKPRPIGWLPEGFEEDE